MGGGGRGEAERVSFAIGSADDDTPDKVEAFLAKVMERATRVARVEATIGQRMVASTDVSLLGDARTTTRLGAAAEDVRLHLRAVKMALRRRRQWIRIVLKTLETAALISTGNPLVALPAAWRFMRAMKAEFETLEAAGDAP